jgi:hypothetical protein
MLRYDASCHPVPVDTFPVTVLALTPPAAVGLARPMSASPRPPFKEVAMRRPLLVALLALLLAPLLGAASPASASVTSDSRSRDVPPELQPPAGQQQVLKALGKGAQVYDCDAVTGKWTFREPAATLNQHGRQIGIHYAGPTWELFDGSKVVAAAKVNVPAPHPDRDIPWLLLQATSNAGSGTLSTVDYVQRLFTEGGVAPNGGTCDPASDESVGVPYTATYVFWSDGR